MKTKQCLKKGLRLAGIAVKKATSYNAVKGRLSYRWYNDEFLQEKIKEHREEVTA